MKRIKQFLCDEQGVTAIEYALIAALISVTVIGGARAIGLAIEDRFYGPLSTNLS